MKHIMLRFLLEGGHVVDAMMTSDEVERVTREWAVTSNGERLRGTSKAGGSAWLWAVDLSRVLGMVTLPEVPQVGSSLSGPGTSGGPNFARRN